MTEAQTVQEGMDAILAKIQSERPTLREYLRSRSSGEGMSSQALEREHPGCAQAAYRAGSCNAYLDIERMIDRDGFAPE